MGRSLGKTAKFRQKAIKLSILKQEAEMHISDLVVIIEIAAAIVGTTAVITINLIRKAKGIRTVQGLPWPLDAIAVWLLNQVGIRWTEVFYNAVNRITALTAVYCMIIREMEGRVQIHMMPRNDILYPNSWHCEGSMVRFRDRPGKDLSKLGFDDAIERVRAGELKGVQFAGTSFAGLKFIFTPRGAEIAVCMLVALPEGVDPKVGKWFDVDRLPLSTIRHERQLYPIAVEKFLEMKRKT